MENTGSTLLYFFIQSVQFSHSVMSNSTIPWTAACQASLSITNSWRLLKLMSIKSVIPSNNLILVIPFSFCLQSFPASGSFPMCQFYASGGQRVGASASVLPMNIQDWFPRVDWLDLLVLQGTLESLLQNYSSKASILWCSAFFTVQLSHPYVTAGKIIALTRWTFVRKVIFLLFNGLSRFARAFHPRSKCLLI